jgi:hypothetical protein
MHGALAIAAGVLIMLEKPPGTPGVRMRISGMRAGELLVDSRLSSRALRRTAEQLS